MNEKELDVKMAEFNLRSSRIRAREAKVEMEEGYKRLKAKMEAQYESLKCSYEAALLDVEEAEIHLTHAKKAVEKNFD